MGFWSRLHYRVEIKGGTCGRVCVQGRGKWFFKRQLLKLVIHTTKMGTTIGGSQNDATNKVSGIGESGGERCAYNESSQCDRSIQNEQNIQSRSG
jgi:hypothetical protein